MLCQLYNHILSSLPFTPSDEQHECIKRLCDFSIIPIDHKVFLLTGYAGTGKTTVISAYINALKRLNHNIVLMAPTGRAAKVLSRYSDTPATSIHKAIYRQKSAGSSEFALNYNKYKNTIFIVDEASMISNLPSVNSNFGSGQLLFDLVEFVYTGDNCQMILLGDQAQLQPIGETTSPALDIHNLQCLGLDVYTYELTEVLRQNSDSGILHNATTIRHAIANPLPPPIFTLTFPDVLRVGGEDLIDHICSSYSSVGIENTTIITYSNKRSILFNRGVRNQVMYKEDELSNGDFLVITRNNYFWSEPYDGLDFIANGETAEIVRLGKHYEIYGLRYVDVSLRLTSYDMDIDARILIDSLYTDTQTAVNSLNQKILEEATLDYPDITTKKELWKELRKNNFVNALQVKFAYSITCHKAQGGQWPHVYIDQGYLPDGVVDGGYYQWLYTAITRAEEKLFLVNFNESFFK